MRIIILIPLIFWNLAASHIVKTSNDRLSFQEAVDQLEAIALDLDQEEEVRISSRVKRDGDEHGVTNLDIRDAILQLLNVVREGNNNVELNQARDRELLQQILEKMTSSGGGGMSLATDKKIDNISTFLLRMNGKLDALERTLRRGSSASADILQTLAQESYDILSLLPTYIENTKKSVTDFSKETDERLKNLEYLLGGDGGEANGNGQKSIANILQSTEEKILSSSSNLKDIVIESGQMAESLFERVNDGYKELTNEIKGLSNLEEVLIDTADSVMDTKRKVEFGVQQIIYKVGELVKLSGGEIDSQLKDQFADITRTILSNQTEALGNLTRKVEKEIGQVWRQMGVMYKQVSNSIGMLEKVKDFTEGYVNRTGKNLGTMEGQVEGLTDRMVDVDSNLNYMLGQLSLVVQEFNMVKTGLGEAMSGLGNELEEIKEYNPSNQDQIKPQEENKN